MKKKRSYSRKCGICGDVHDQSDMIRDDQSPTGWVCLECQMTLHPEYDMEEW